MRIYLFLLLLSISAFADMESLLGKLAQEDDLSAQTKKESAGYLTVYTRADIDQMKLKSLKELIEQIPFIRYNENKNGLTDPFYQPYQPTNSNGIKVYIDEREQLSPYSGSGLQLLGQISLDYIDHIEIYMGIPAQSFGLKPSAVTIKCYSKDPKREQTNLIGSSIGSYNTNKLYGYTAQTSKGYDYLLSVSHERVNTKDIQHNASTLSKDKEINNLFAKIKKNNLTLDMQISQSKLDGFIGNSYNIDPIHPTIDVDYYYMGLYYDNQENGIKASASFAYDSADIHDDSYSVLGVIQIPVFPFVLPYDTSNISLKEKLSNVKFFKTFKTTKNELMLGVQGRSKQFKIEKLEFGTTQIPILDYNEENILSLSAEEQYFVNKSNMFIGSIVYNKHYENSVVRDYETTSGRLGYIYNNNTFTSKSFVFIGENTPDMKVLYNNRAIYHQDRDPSTAKQLALSTEITYKSRYYKTSLLYGHTKLSSNIYFDGTGYKNSAKSIILDTFSYKYSYEFNALNRLLLNTWLVLENNKNLITDKKQNRYGGYITLFNRIGKLDFYNNIVYKKWRKGLERGFNFNSTITYKYSRSLNLFVKANNIFEKALQSNYYSINPLTNNVSHLNDINTIERTLLIGLEYQF